jgi:hypothetical protein
MTARKWPAKGSGLDGIVAKPLDQPYRPGERIMRKYKVWHTVDAVLGGYYEDEATGTVDSLLFGLYGDDGLLHFVGHSRVYNDAAEILCVTFGKTRIFRRVEPGVHTSQDREAARRWQGKVLLVAKLGRIGGVGIKHFLTDGRTRFLGHDVLPDRSFPADPRLSILHGHSSTAAIHLRIGGQALPVRGTCRCAEAEAAACPRAIVCGIQLCASYARNSARGASSVAKVTAPTSSSKLAQLPARPSRPILPGSLAENTDERRKG